MRGNIPDQQTKQGGEEYAQVWNLRRRDAQAAGYQRGWLLRELADGRRKPTIRFYLAFPLRSDFVPGRDSKSVNQAYCYIRKPTVGEKRDKGGKHDIGGTGQPQAQQQMELHGKDVPFAPQGAHHEE